MTDLNEIVGEAIQRRSILGDHIEIVFSPWPEPVLTTAGKDETEQLVMQLASLGVEAMPKGGKLHIAVSPTSVRDEFAALCLSVPIGEYATLAVSDTGDGLGSDLSAARVIAERCGGGISQHPTPGIGTAVRAFLPSLPFFATAERAAVLEEAEPENAPRGTETILLVEDELAVSAYLTSVLAERGYEVLAASSAREAMRVASRHDGPIDVLLTDMALPGSSGSEIVDSIAGLRPGIRVLRMSGHVDPTGATVDNVLEKPFRPAVLLQRIRTLLDSGRPMTSAAALGQNLPSQPSEEDREEEDPAKE